MGRKAFLLLGLTAIAGAAPLSAGTPGREFDVVMHVDGGSMGSANPRLRILVGSSSTYETADNSYHVRMTTTASEDGRVSVAYESNAWTPTGLSTDVETLALRADGRPGTVSFERTDPTTGHRIPVRIEIRVLPID